MVTCLTIAFLSSIIFSVGFRSVHAAEMGKQVVGTVTRSGCSAINGTVESNFLASNNSQWIDLCKHGEQNYEILDQQNSILGPQGCIAQVGTGIDSYSNKSYTFGNPCNVPRGCNSSSDWQGNLPVLYIHKLNVRINEKDYAFLIGARDFFCTYKEFSVEKKAFQFDAITRNTGQDPILVRVAIPEEALGGNYTIFVDGNMTKTFMREQKDGYAILTMNLPSSENYEKKHFEIVGTKVMPEFGSLTLLLISICITGAIVGTGFSRANNR